MAWADLVLAELEALRLAGLLREPAPVDRCLEDACSNDYLGLAVEPLSPPAPGAAGAGASRLIHGTHPAHAALEADLAAWVEQPQALLFASGYAANVGLLQALASDTDDLIVSDALNHASIIDGARLARGRVAVTPHLDVEAVDRALESGASARRRILVVEGYYSMDGHRPDLGALRRVTLRRDALLVVDEAHALGVYGPAGAGALRAAGVTADAVVGTLGKAVGVQGAFVACAEPLRALLWNRARSFVFSTATSPLLAELTRERVARVRRADPARERLHRHADALRAALKAGGADTLASEGPIVPVACRSESHAVAASRDLAARGWRVQAIRPPTVPRGGSRLRLTAHATWADEVPPRLAAAVLEALSRSP